MRRLKRGGPSNNPEKQQKLVSTLIDVNNTQLGVEHAINLQQL